MPLPGAEFLGEVPEAISAIAQQLCGAPVVSVEACGGGGNNCVYRIQTLDRTYALKSYGPASLDDRDRLGHEYDGLRFLEGHGVSGALPAALAVDRASRCALYEWIPGKVPIEHDTSDVSAVLGLLAKLHDARHAPGAAKLPSATEAVLRLCDLLSQIGGRLERLKAVTSAEADLAAFLETEVQPEVDRRSAALLPWDIEAALPHSARTLSPSDFGFHNSLRRSDGSLVFIDFEYFGWDDPAKLGADFLWHPAMKLSAEERACFLDGIARLYADDPNFAQRFATCYPLYGIRWVLIILNEFLPKLWARRAFSGKGGDWEGAKRAQLQKARTMLAALRSHTEGQPRP